MLRCSSSALVRTGQCAELVTGIRARAPQDSCAVAARKLATASDLVAICE